MKTTDAYRISLDTLATYRSKLRQADLVGDRSSILIVVGRQETGELEEQIRGSKHAWDIRLISAEALTKLVRLKENADESETASKIRNLLTPLEYTRLDKMIDVMFSTVTDVEGAIDAAELEDEAASALHVPEIEVPKGTWQFTDSVLLQNKRNEIFEAVGKSLGTKLIKKSRALYWDSSHEARVICTISKRYTKKGSYAYWFAYHPQWDHFIQETKDGFLVLGCMDLSFAFSIPAAVIHEATKSLNTTTTERGTYWHIHITEPSAGKFQMLLPKASGNLDLEPYRVTL